MITKGMFTVIGSWPFTDVDKITNIIKDNFIDIPAWPQLPKLNFFENMYVQYSEGLPCVVIDEKNEKIFFETSGDLLLPIQTVYENFLNENYDYFKISERYARGLYNFKNKFSGSTRIKLVKGQTLGPISLSLTLTDETKKLIFYNEQLSDAILKSCICKSIWQAKFLKEFADNVIIFLDEPYLVSFGSAFINISREQVINALNEIIDKLHELDIITGVHCCGNTDWSILIDSNVDILNFDAYTYSNSIMLYPEKINKFLSEKNKFLAWGIVPTLEEKIFSENSESIFEKLILLQKKLSLLGVDKKLITEKTIITPSCGTGSLSEQAAERVVELLKSVSNLYKKFE